MGIEIYKGKTPEPQFFLPVPQRDEQAWWEQYREAEKAELWSQCRNMMAVYSGYRALTPQKASQLQHVFPQAYFSDDYGAAPEGNTWACYQFDQVPTNALREINTARELKLPDGDPVFDWLEIWTPERSTYDDPFVVGVVSGYYRERHTYYPITRWGEAMAPLSSLIAQWRFGELLPFLTLGAAILIAALAHLS